MFLLIESPSVSRGDDPRTPQVSISQNAQVPYVNTASLYLKDYLLITCVYTTIYFKSSLGYLQYLCCVVLSCPVVSDCLRPPWTVALQAPLFTEILQARILEWAAMPSSRGSSQPRDRTQVSRIAGRLFIVYTRKAQEYLSG